MIELQLNPSVTMGAAFVDDWNNQTNVLPNGKQQRIGFQSKMLCRGTVSYTAIDEDDHIELRNFKIAVRGSLIAFRFRNWGNYKSDGQQSCSPATGNGVITAFQLQKTHTIASPGTSHVKTITKPVSGSVQMFVNGAEVLSGWTVNTATGVVTFSVAPTNGHTVKATFQFDLPGHFVNSDMPYTVEQDAGELSVFHHDGMEIEEVDEI
jgi:uncharacterized protein (TIGR02217 family)